MDIESIELEDSLIHSMEKQVDEYLLHNRYLKLKLNLSDNSSVEIEPYKNSWLISMYINLELQKQERENYFPQAVKKFKEMSVELLKTLTDRHIEEERKSEK